MVKTIGEFEISVFSGGYPVIADITYRGETFRINHKEINDLEHAVKEIKRAMIRELPEKCHNQIEGN